MGGHLICRLVTVFGQRSYQKSQIYVCDPQNVVGLKFREADNKNSLELHWAILRSVKKNVRTALQNSLRNRQSYLEEFSFFF
jgi:hypothetical protein